MLGCCMSCLQAAGWEFWNLFIPFTPFYYSNPFLWTYDFDGDVSPLQTPEQVLRRSLDENKFKNLMADFIEWSDCAPRDSTRYVSAAWWLCHGSGADRFHSSLCVNFHQVHCASYLLLPSSGSPKPSTANTQDFYFWWVPEHDAAIQPNLAQSRQEVTHWNYNLTSGSSTNPSVGNTLCCCVSNTRL